MVPVLDKEAETNFRNSMIWKKLPFFIVLFIAGYFLDLIFGNIFVAIVGCVLLGIVLERRNKPSPPKPLAFTQSKVASLQCGVCGVAMLPGWEFCRKCGSPLKASIMMVSGRQVIGAVPFRGKPFPVPQAQLPLGPPSITNPPPPISGFCMECGTQIKPGKHFCIKCGAPVASTSQTNDQTNVPTCSNCGSRLAAGKKFCTSCGRRLVAS